VWTGASTGPELDGVLASVDGIELRMPYESGPVTRAKFNPVEMEYVDLHLSHVAQIAWEGFFGHFDTAVIEVTGVSEDGDLTPSSSIGNNKTRLDLADRVILEVNAWQPRELQGMHDIYCGTALPPNHKPVPILQPSDRIGVTTFRCDPEKIVAVVETNSIDRNSPFKEPDQDSVHVAGHIIEFFHHEVKAGRLPANLLPLQSGVGNIANAVLTQLDTGPFRPLTASTEVIQDGMLQMLRSGTLGSASATAFSLSESSLEEFRNNIDFYRERIVLRPREIRNHPEVIRRLGCLAMNGMIEANIYGNVNSTHIMGSRIENGIGGSGDFARNDYISMFVTSSTAKNGTISRIVPMVSHVDHTEHDVQIIVSEQGVADLRGLSPRQRAKQIVGRCVHPDFRAQLQDYFDRAQLSAAGLQTPHLLIEAFSWHTSYMTTGSMRLH
jgi:succinyl-CoA:acetate CoA-transferase